MDAKQQPGFLDCLGQEVEVKALGKTWRLDRLELGHWDEFRKWARTVLEDPIIAAHNAVTRLAREEYGLRRRLNAALEAQKKGEPRPKDENGDEDDPDLIRHLITTNSDEQRELTRRGMDLKIAFLDFSSPEFQGLVGSVRGQARLYWLLLQKNHPGTPETVAFQLVMGLGQDAAQAMLDKAGGALEPKNDSAPAA